jgi:16S rRNA (uracil1498-N3)-methyltransferase
MIFSVVDAAGAMWRGRLTELGDHGGILIPFQRSLRSLESPLQLTVYQALPEKERFELILEKLTELGVTRIVPIVSQQSSTLAARDAKQQKSHRWPEVLRRWTSGAWLQWRVVCYQGQCRDYERDADHDGIDHQRPIVKQDR